MADPRPSSFEPVRAALAGALLLGGVGFLVDLVTHYGLDQALRLFGHADWGRLGPPAASSLLLPMAGMAAVAIPVGALMMRGLNRDSFAVFLGLVVGAVVAYSIWGGRSGGLAHYLYDGDLPGLRRYLAMWAALSPAVVLVLLLACLWRVWSVKSGARRRANRRGLADA